jgi:hypothetical protein
MAPWATLKQRQVILLVQAVDALEIDAPPALPAQHNVDALAPVAHPRGGNLLDAVTQRSLIGRDRSVVTKRARDHHRLARLADAGTVPAAQIAAQHRGATQRTLDRLKPFVSAR